MTTTINKSYDQRLAGWLIRPLVNTWVHPNHLTILSLIVGVSAAAVFAFGGIQNAGLAALLYMLAVFLDHTDGELARMAGKTSRLGHILDFLVGSTIYTLMFIGVGWGLYTQGAGPWAAVLGFAAGLSHPVIVTLRMTMDIKFGAESVAHPRAGGFEIEDFIYLIGPITWAGGLVYFLIVYGLGTLGYLGWTSWCFWRHWNSRAA
jgi:phosphatidylglycerophosphate synthase